MGVDPEQLLELEDLVCGDEVYFAASGISDGNLLKGVIFDSENMAKTHSIVMRAETGTIRFVEAIHRLNKKPYIHANK